PFRPYYATQLAFHPSLPILAALGKNDTLIRLWELDYGLLLKSPSVRVESEEIQEQAHTPTPPITPEPTPPAAELTPPAETVPAVEQTSTAAAQSQAAEATAVEETPSEVTTPTLQETLPATPTPIAGAAQSTETFPTTEPKHEEEKVHTATDDGQQVREDKPEERSEQKPEQKLEPEPEHKSDPEPSPEESNLPEERFFAATSGDQPTSEDSIGFTPYVNAIAEFLSNEKTKAPLTLSIEGEWGSGKSSFMLQLEKELLNRIAPRKRRMLWRA